MRTALHTFGLLLLFYTGISCAALYKWVDEKGNTHYTTAPPPESAVHDREMLGSRGQVLKTIQGRMTPEEKAAYEKKLYEEEQAAKELARQQKRDRNLLISYKKEEELTTKRDEKLATLDEYIRSLVVSRDASHFEYEELLNQAILHEREGKVPPEKLKADLRSAKREFDGYEADLKKAKQEHLNTSKEYDADIKRWRQLKGLE
ncbi:MAG: DUF4124 domain-containing protein [Gammaproteobacteria bacterium]|nr:DUF4124 domain-containing protein [Gammaproteobacteria bacterium]